MNTRPGSYAWHIIPWWTTFLQNKFIIDQGMTKLWNRHWDRQTESTSKSLPPPYHYVAWRHYNRLNSRADNYHSASMCWLIMACAGNKTNKITATCTRSKVNLLLPNLPLAIKSISLKSYTCTYYLSSACTFWKHRVLKLRQRHDFNEIAINTGI